ncbi:dethiobiotin synthase (plasmid) [Sinorhizobium numidicum]|uniref:ATP-dependent dethiobiotin synthetase BioD n=1 Tax=Sinorhizobium numidicum TaxID=680248 RepID=A0ABY8D6Y2_9HYPH|nr:dethiobiotin synthase [Sinorhizobium numidicum]WEX79587.1 dethiobiotin synthase [Sinorhizobium numidicum]WEX85457.1 dethiobiotin synthase [Sinorhizobium numidicum]
MTLRLLITGTDTDIGKTVFAAALTDALSGYYWKPVQSGLEDATDSETARQLGQIAPDRILPEAYRLTTPASPHLSAKLDGVTILADDLSPPETDAPLVIEGAGGLMVPLTDQTIFADVFARWRIPVVLCARTGLGTINHTLLSLEALRARSIPVLGVAFIGDEQADTQAIIAVLGQVRVLGRLPRLEPLTPDALRQAFRANFDIDRFREAAV